MSQNPSPAPAPARPLIVGIGGTPRSGSSSERALEFALARAREFGADTELLAGHQLILPIYVPEAPERNEAARHLVSVLRRANGIIVASPGYHGSLSGLIKNALDYAEDMRDDALPYFEGRAVGLIACAFGWQATGTTLHALRSIVHALRGWPTPMGAAINSSESVFDKSSGVCIAPRVAQILDLMAEEILSFAGAPSAV
jgi:FMN reductase